MMKIEELVKRLHRKRESIRDDECETAAAALETQAARIAELEARIKELETAPQDLTWFWEIVDRDGLANMPSCERQALADLMRRISYLAAQVNTLNDREAQWRSTSIRQGNMIAELEAQVKALREAAIAISYSQGFGECEGLADFESVQLTATQGAIRAIVAALEMSEKSNVER